MKLFRAIGGVFLCLCVSVVSAQNRIALVIGNADYDNSPLANPTNDANDVSNSLRELGFDVILKTNTSQQGMEDAIKQFGRKLEKGGVGLFFYSGHGVQANGRNYLIPVEADIEREKDLKYKAVDVGQVMDEMGYAGNGMNIVILDACRDNPLTRSFRNNTRGLARMKDVPSGLLIAYSTSPGDVAADGEGRNSPYTQSFIKQLKKPGLPLELVFKEVTKDVKKQSRGKQIPWMSSSVTGDFYFVAGEAVVPVSSATVPANTGELIIDPQQSDAKVYLNGRYIGDGRQTLSREPGQYLIEVSKAGYHSNTRWVKLEKKDKRNIYVSMNEKTQVINGIEPIMVPITYMHNDFAIGKYEITQGQWQMVMASNPSQNTDCGKDCPVENVSWDDVQLYIKTLNHKTGKKYRLPTSDEWESACLEDYCGSEVAADVAWYKNNSGSRTHPVGQKLPNHNGLYDMKGNVAEWLSNCNGDDCSRKLVTGGFWGSEKEGDLTSNYYIAVKPSSRYNGIGFRLAQDL